MLYGTLGCYYSCWCLALWSVRGWELWRSVLHCWEGDYIAFLSIDLTSKLVHGFTHSQNNLSLVRKMKDMMQKCNELVSWYKYSEDGQKALELWEEEISSGNLVTDGQEAVKCRVWERENLEGYTNWVYINKKVEYTVKEILTCISMFLYGNKQCGVHGSCGKMTLQWYSSKLQVTLWARNASKNSLGSSCIPSNQNLFCWLKHTGNGKTLLRRFSTSALLFNSHVPTNVNGVY